ncbi:MAG: DNA repair protein RecO [Ignavibacteria bacterium]|jgi:DNA repair protein RecO (recombination protein O)
MAYFTRNFIPIFMIITDTAIILHGRKYSDTSKIIHAYTKNHGKISVIAKGVRSAKNTMGSSIEALRCSSITWYRYPNKDLHLLKSAEIAIPLHNLTSDYDRLMSAMGIIEILSGTQEPEEPNPSIFESAIQALMALNEFRCQESPYAITLLFLMQLAAIMGFAIHVQSCPITGELIQRKEGETVFSLDKGGVLSDGIINPSGETILLNSSAVSILQEMEHAQFETCSLHIPLQEQITLLNLFQRYFSYHSHKSYRWNTYPPGITTT